MDLLKKLSETPSVPGREDRIRQVIREYVEPLVDEVRVDAMGSLITVRKPRPAGEPAAAPRRVMLAAHMDQIGFLVSHIDDKGYLRVNPVGGFDTRNLFARRVRVCTAEGDLQGVMNPATKPVHIATEEDRKRIPEIAEFYIDLGMNEEQVRQRVKIGDMVVLDATFDHVGDTAVGQCLDNRVGCWAVIRMLQQLKHHDCEIHAVWTVQEEVGLRGAMPAAFSVEPDIGISCDTTLCCQTPGVPDEQRVTEFGAGVCLKIMDSSTIANLGLVEQVEAVAEKRGIKCQRGVLPRGGQDGAMIQRSRGGVPVAVFACPVKYIHTAAEMCHQDDLQSYPALLAAWLETL